MDSRCTHQTKQKQLHSVKRTPPHLLIHGKEHCVYKQSVSWVLMPWVLVVPPIPTATATATATSTTSSHLYRGECIKSDSRYMPT
ncbi:Potassium voltage-gated channel subfamily H member [Dirofilaria immitis]